MDSNNPELPPTNPNTEPSGTSEGYFAHVDILEYDRTIVAHPWMDQLKAGVIYRLTDIFGTHDQHTILDFGAGTGQLTRLLLPFQNFSIHAADEDWRAKEFFSIHPELSRVPFAVGKFPHEPLPTNYDAIVMVGVNHHVPKHERVQMLAFLRKFTKHLLIADEGLQEYKTVLERQEYCRSWYGVVISEARRRGIQELAELEEQFLADDLKANLDSSHDFKESPTDVAADAAAAGWKVLTLDRIGDWDKYHGGMYVVSFVPR